MVTINIGRKAMIFFSVVILVFAVVGFSVAFGGNQPAVVGHTAGEIERCADGETLVMSGGEWTCGVGSGGGASYDSGWFSVAKQTDYTRTHNLGNRPDIVEVWFSPDSAGSSAVLISDGWTDAAGVHGIQIREVTSSDIKITTSHQYLATSVNNPRITYHSGYVKII